MKTGIGVIFLCVLLFLIAAILNNRKLERMETRMFTPINLKKLRFSIGGFHNKYKNDLNRKNENTNSKYVRFY